MTTASNTIPNQDLEHYIDALRNYKKTGYRQSRSILAALKKANLSLLQISELQPSPWLRLIEKIEPADDDEKEFKQEMQELMQGLNKRYSQLKSGSLSKMSRISKENTDGKENQNINNISASEPQTEEKVLTERTQEPKEDTRNDQREDEDKNTSGDVPQAVRDFTVKNLTQGLLVDYKDDPAAKKEVQPKATEKASEIENIIREETKADPEAYRMEARNVSTYLLTKDNENLREGILRGEIDCENFVTHKEEFINDHAKEVVEENEKRHYMDVNADFDRKMVPESPLYKCENCGSTRIQKTEKQMRFSDRSSSTVLVCAECETVVVL